MVFSCSSNFNIVSYTAIQHAHMLYVRLCIQPACFRGNNQQTDSLQFQMSQWIRQILTMEEELTPLDCLLPSGTGPQSHSPLETHLRSIHDQLYRQVLAQAHTIYTPASHAFVWDTQTQTISMHLIKTCTYSHHCHTYLPLSNSPLALTHTNSLRGIETQIM